MPVSAGTAFVDIRGEFAKLGQDIKTGVTKSVGQAESNLAGRFSSFGKNLGRNLLAGVGITFAAAGLIKFIGSSVQAAQEAEQSQLKLNQAFKIFPALANVNIEALRKLNTQMSFKTKFDDDALASGEAVLAQFKLTGQQVKEIIPLVADYAAKTGQDIPSAATALGRAFLGNTRALKTIGINFKASGDTAKDYTTIVGLLRAKVGGFAEAEGKTFSGRLEILKTQFGELKESIGRAVLPFLSSMANFVVAKLLPALGDFAKVLIKTFGPTVKALIDSFKTAWNLMFPILRDIAAVIGITLLGALKLLAAVLKPLAPVIAAIGTALIIAFTSEKIIDGIEAITVGISVLAAKMHLALAVEGPIAFSATAAAATKAASALEPAIARTLALTAAREGLGKTAARSALALQSEIRATSLGIGPQQAFGAAVLNEMSALRAQAIAATEATVKSTGFGAALAALVARIKASATSLLIAIGPMITLATVIASVVSTYKVLQRAQDLATRANQATADSFLNDTIPTLLKTGGTLELTAQQWSLLGTTIGGSDLDRAKKVFDDLGKGVIGTAEAFHQLKDIAGLTQDAIDQVVTSELKQMVVDAKITGDYKGVALAAQTAFRAAGTSAEQIGLTLRGLSSGALYQLQQSFTKAGIPAAALSNIMLTAQTPIKAITFATQGLTKAQIKYNESVLAENEQVDALTKRFDALGTQIDHFKKSLDATLGVQLTLEQATSSYDQDLAALGQSLKDNGRSFDLNTEKGRNNSSALRAVVGDIEDMIAAEVRAGIVSGSDARQKDRLIGRLKELEIRYPALKPKIEDYIRTVNKTPVSRTTTLKANIKPALDALSEFEYDLKRFGGRIAKESRFDINVSASANLSSITARDVNLTATNVYVAGRAHAKGGFAPYGEVGIYEHGVEIAIPRPGGFDILTSQQSAHVLNQASSGDTYNVTVINPKPEPSGDSMIRARKYSQLLRQT